MSPSISLPPVLPTQLSTRSVEIVESVTRKSFTTPLSIWETEPLAISPRLEIPENGAQSVSQETTQISAPIYQWSAALERRFGRLTARVAAEVASPAEKNEFAKLRTARRQVYLVRSGAQVLLDFEKRQRTAALVQALQKYVEIASH